MHFTSVHKIFSSFCLFRKKSRKGYKINKNWKKQLQSVTSKKFCCFINFFRVVLTWLTSSYIATYFCAQIKFCLDQKIRISLLCVVCSTRLISLLLASLLFTKELINLNIFKLAHEWHNCTVYILSLLYNFILFVNCTYLFKNCISSFRTVHGLNST